MNFLAHIYLSGNDEEIKIGNFIADHIKGSAINLLPEKVKRGVKLHRMIDAFTDSHPIVAESKSRLYPEFKKYAPVITDIYYDHFLASRWLDYSEEPLPSYAEKFYEMATGYLEIFPERTKQMFTYMQANNWLVTYATTEGIDRVLTGMSRRTPFASNMENAAAELEKNYSQYENEFKPFFEELKKFSEKLRGEL
jgi:acyl carrier protein phosphodiesterase